MSRAKIDPRAIRLLRDAGLRKTEIARMLRIDERSVRRALDGYEPSRIRHILAELADEVELLSDVVTFLEQS